MRCGVVCQEPGAVVVCGHVSGLYFSSTSGLHCRLRCAGLGMCFKSTGLQLCMGLGGVRCGLRLCGSAPCVGPCASPSCPHAQCCPLPLAQQQLPPLNCLGCCTHMFQSGGEGPGDQQLPYLLLAPQSPPPSCSRREPRHLGSQKPIGQGGAWHGAPWVGRGQVTNPPAQLSRGRGWR